MTKNKKIIVSGLKPSGILHIGNYLGVIKKAIELQNQNKYKCFYFIADYHSLTVNFNPKERHYKNRKYLFGFRN